jgi:surface protein
VHKTDGIKDTSKMFAPTSNTMTNVTEIIFEPTVDTSAVTNMSNMFYACAGLTSLDLSNFNTSNVTDMQRMFRECRNIETIDATGWDTSKVTTFYFTFGYCDKLLNIIGNIDTSSATSLRAMFYALLALEDLDVSNMNITNATDMVAFLKNSTNLKSVKFPSGAPAADFGSLLYGCTKLECLNQIDTTNATNTTDMFLNCGALTAPDATDQTAIEGGASWTNPNSCPAADLDHDGIPDTDVADFATAFGHTRITEDSDSINIDIDGDGTADIIIPK